MPSLSRRSILMGATADGVRGALEGAFASTPSSPRSAAVRVTRVDDGRVLPQSVASGDPTASGVTPTDQPGRGPGPDGRPMRRLALAGLAAGLVAAALPAQAAAEEVCRFTDDRITESSGLVLSTRSDRVLFTHNDSGDDARFFAVDDRCRTLATYVLPDVEAVDWEDMARGPGPAGRPALWFGDIGDNAMTRSEVVVQRVDEPPAQRRSGTPVAIGSTAFRLVYEDGAHDAETLLADPRTGRLLVVTKTYAGLASVYAAPEVLDPEGVNILARVGEVLLPPSGTDGGPVGPFGQLATTGGDVSRDGTRVVVRTYTDAYEWDVEGGDVLGALTLTAPSRRTPLPATAQGEAVGYTSDSRTLWVSSEGAGAPVHRIRPMPSS